MRFFTVAVLLLICFGLGLAISLQMRAKTADPTSLDIGCRIQLAGSNTIGERLAPAIVSAYLAADGFTIEAPQKTGEDEVRVNGVRGEERCAVDIRSHGSSLAFKELTEGATEIGMASRPIKIEETEALRAASAGDFEAEAALAEHVVGLDGIAVIVHPSNPLRALSRRDIRRIFVGEAADWRDVGDGRGAIELYARDDQSGTFQFFADHVLENDSRWDRAKATARRYASSSELVAGVAADPLAIGFVGMAYVTPAVRALAVSDGGPAFEPTESNVRSESYPISRRLFLYARPQTMRDNPRVAGLVAFFKSEAAYAAIEELGYVSLRPTPRPDAVAQTETCAPGAPESEVYRVATAHAQRLESVIRFLPGSNDVDSLARDDVGRAANAIRGAVAQGRVVRLIGHSDSEGDSALNRRLALQRADAIRQAFEGLNVLGLQVESAGEMCPVANNDTPAGRRTNRRVEIWIAA